MGQWQQWVWGLREGCDGGMVACVPMDRVVWSWLFFASFSWTRLLQTTPDWPESLVSTANIHFHCLLKQRIS